MSKKLRPTILLTLLLAFASASVIAAPGDAAAKATTPTTKATAQPIAKVNGIAIGHTAVEAFVHEQMAQGVPDTPELRKAVRDELIRRELVAQAAKKKGFDKKADYAVQVELAKQAILIRAFMQDYMRKNVISDDALKAHYEKVKQQAKGKEYKSRHILVESEAEARSVIDKLTLGEKFEVLAKASKDPGSKETGGDLGWSQAQSFVQPFADALTALEKGKFTTAPIKSEFGFHVIQLDDVRTSEPPPFDKVKGQIAQHLQQQQVEKMIADLKAKAKIE